MPLFDYEDEVFDPRGRSAKPAKNSGGGRLRRVMRRMFQGLLILVFLIYVLPFLMAAAVGIFSDDDPLWMVQYFEWMQHFQRMIANGVSALGQ